MSGFVTLSVNSKGTATVTLNRPPVNALNRDMQQQLTDIFHEIMRRSDIHLVVLKASDECRDFCTGIDVDELAMTVLSKNPEKNLEDSLIFARMLDAVAACNQPIIGIVKKAAFGAGATLAALCDHTVAALDTKFCYPEKRMALKASISAPYVAAAIGTQNAFEHFFRGDVFTAREAQALGIVDGTCDESELRRVEDTLVKQFESGAPMRKREKHLPVPIDESNQETAAVAALVNNTAALYADRSPAGREKLIRATAEDLKHDRMSHEAQEKVREYYEQLHGRHQENKPERRL